jgi:DNA-binding NarL/FixJ family response regulator
MRAQFLIVDDSHIVRQGLRAILQANPEWQVCGEADDGFSAVEMFKELHPSFVIMDFQMPGMNGIECARRILAIAPAVPIVMFTQHASQELEQHAMEAGIQVVVSKADTFSMIGVIEALLEPGDPISTAEEERGEG